MSSCQTWTLDLRLELTRVVWYERQHDITVRCVVSRHATGERYRQWSSPVSEEWAASDVISILRHYNTLSETNPGPGTILNIGSLAVWVECNQRVLPGITLSGQLSRAIITLLWFGWNWNSRIFSFSTRLLWLMIWDHISRIARRFDRASHCQSSY